MNINEMNINEMNINEMNINEMKKKYKNYFFFVLQYIKYKIIK